MMSRFTSVVLAAIVLVALLAQASFAVMVVIDDPTDLDLTGLGSSVYAPIGGATFASAPGQVDDLIKWQGSSDTESINQAAISTIGGFLSLIPGSNPVTSAVFGLGVNQNGDTLADAAEMTQFDIMFGGTMATPTTTLSWGSDTLKVIAYGAGASEGEAFIQVNFGTDLRALNSSEFFGITATIQNRDDGFELLFLTDLAVIPEPSAFLFGGLVCGVVGACLGGRRLARTRHAKRSQ